MSEQIPDTRVFTMVEADIGQRLDIFLTDHCPDLSRSQIARAIDSDGVRVNGRARPRGFRLRADSEISFTPLSPIPTTAEPQDLPLEIVHRDPDFVIVDKAPGMVVHPAPGHRDGTLVNALLHAVGGLPGSGESLRPGIVHRLDRDTSGLLVVALTPEAHRNLAEQLRARTLGRTYNALSWGQWDQSEGTLESSIGRHPTQRVKMAVLPRGGREAITRYSVLDDFGFAQFCAVKLETGRTHQIRVQFTHAGHPIVGDPVYGDDNRARNTLPVDRVAAQRMVKTVQRQMLHAAELRLVHPRTGESLTFTSPLPPDFAEVLAGMRQGREE